jgi:hypothetical protein
MAAAEEGQHHPAPPSVEIRLLSDTNPPFLSLDCNTIQPAALGWKARQAFWAAPSSDTRFGHFPIQFVSVVSWCYHYLLINSVVPSIT